MSKAKNIRSPIAAGLWERKHREKMKGAIFLFGWLCSRQTRANGLVFAGRGMTYTEISDSMDEKPKTVEFWMANLKRHKYIEVKYTLYKRMVIRVLNQKKFATRQMPLAYPEPTRDTTEPISRAESGYDPGHKPLPTRDIDLSESGFKDDLKSDSLLTLSAESDADAKGKPLAALASSPAVDAEIVSVEDTFAVFWNVYPRQFQRLKAKYIFVKMKLDAHLAEILLSVEAWMQSGAWDDETFVPYPANFLKNKLWLEKPPEKKNGNKRKAERRFAANLAALREVLGTNLRGVDSEVRRTLPTHTHRK